MSENFYIFYFGDEILDNKTYEKVKETMDKSLDWYRIERKVWIAYTSSDAEKWYERLDFFKNIGGNIFICKLDISDRQGWMNKKFWSWIREVKE